jgi:hypothetical protein
MGGGQTFNFGFPHTELFHYLGAYSAAPNTQAPTQTLTDLAKFKQNAKYVYMSYGSTDGLVNNGQKYHTFLDQNNITHVWQLEQGLGHEKRVWDRSFYNFTQKIFTGSGTGIQIKPLGKGERAGILFGKGAMGSTSKILVALPDGKGMITLDGRSVPGSSAASLFEGIHLH